jgi:hypothetical protein
MNLTFEEKKDIAYSRSLLEQWVSKDVPSQIREHLRECSQIDL